MAKTTKLSKSERGLLIAVGIFVLLLLGIGYWHNMLETNPVIMVSTPQLPNPNALKYYTRASDWIDGIKITVGKQGYTYAINDLMSFYQADNRQNNNWSSKPDATWKIAEAFAQKSIPAFTLVHQGFTIDYHDIPVRSLTQHSKALRISDVASALTLTGNVKAHHGDWAGATDDALDAMQLGEEIQHGGGLEASYLGKRCQTDGRTLARKALQHLSGAQARVAARRMEIILARTQPYVNMLQEQKNIYLAIMNECFHQSTWRDKIIGMRSASMDYFISKRLIARNVIHMMDVAINDAQRPYSLQSGALFNGNPFNLVADIQSIGNYRIDITLNETENALLLISYALQAYRAEHGRYPPKLSRAISSVIFENAPQ